EDLYLHDASHRLLEMIVVRKVEANALAEIQERLQNVDERLTSGEESLLAAREEASSIEQAYEQASVSAANLDRSSTQLGSDCDRYTERLAHLSERAQSLEAETAALLEK